MAVLHNAATFVSGRTQLCRCPAVPRRVQTVVRAAICRLDARCATCDTVALRAARELVRRQVAGVERPVLIVDLCHIEALAPKLIDLLGELAAGVARRGGRLGLCGLRPENREALRGTRLESVVPVFDNVDLAFAALTTGRRPIAYV